MPIPPPLLSPDALNEAAMLALPPLDLDPVDACFRLVTPPELLPFPLGAREELPFLPYRPPRKLDDPALALPASFLDPALFDFPVGNMGI